MFNFTNTFEINILPLLLGEFCCKRSRLGMKLLIAPRSSGLIVAVFVSGSFLQFRFFTLIWLSTVWISSAFSNSLFHLLDFIFSVSNVGTNFSVTTPLSSFVFGATSVSFSATSAFCFAYGQRRSFTLP